MTRLWFILKEGKAEEILFRKVRAIMLIREKLKEAFDLSASEQSVAEFLMSSGIEIEHTSTADIAKKTFTSPATVVRLAKKLGFSGWNELKENLQDEIRYMNSHFTDVDANFPFEKEDSLMTVANKIGTLEIETIKDTESLLDFEELHKVVHYLNSANRIFVFGTSVSLILAEKFRYKMVRIGREVTISTLHSEQLYTAAQVKKGDAAVILSYSGEDQFLIEISEHLREQKIDIVSVTNVGTNTIARHSRYNLFCSTREKLNEKVAAYSSINSMDYLLDVLYSGIFSIDYDANVQKRIELARKFEKHRRSDSAQISDKISRNLNS